MMLRLIFLIVGSQSAISASKMYEKALKMYQKIDISIFQNEVSHKTRVVFSQLFFNDGGSKIMQCLSMRHWLLHFIGALFNQMFKKMEFIKCNLFTNRRRCLVHCFIFACFDLFGLVFQWYKKCIQSGRKNVIYFCELGWFIHWYVFYSIQNGWFGFCRCVWYQVIISGFEPHCVYF